MSSPESNCPSIRRFRTLAGMALGNCSAVSSGISVIGLVYHENPALTAGFSRSSRGAQQPRELPQPLFAGVGDRPIRHAGLRPVENVKALPRAGDGLKSRSVRRVGGGPGEEVDDVAVGAVDESRAGMVAAVVEPAADDGEAFRGEGDAGGE